MSTSTPARPRRPGARPLDGLAAAFGLAAAQDLAGLTITGLTQRVQEVRPGDLFAGLPGAAVHGASFADAACRAGAVALLTDDAGAAAAASAGLPVLITASPRALLGEVAAWLHGTREHAPQLLAVTGTNGKTSTAHLLEHLLELLGVPAGVSSTAERGSGAERAAGRLTTPEADELHGWLARLSERGVRCAAIEVSAQALVRDRVAGLHFDVAGFTNLTHEHLDDFGTLEGYLAAKARLFEPGTSEQAVLSLDSPAGATLARGVQIPVITVASASRTGADWTVLGTAVGPDGTRFRLRGPGGERLETRTDLLGAHQAANAALAIVMLITAGHPFERIAEALAPHGLRMPMPGRLERLPGTRGAAVYLDVAHTPDALHAALRTVRQLTRGRVVVAFGADGDRDATKREPMGRVAARGADVVVIHDHHSRFEDPDRIRAMLLRGARGAEAATVLEVPDPVAAIRAALDAAGDDGAVLWAGTGRTAYRDVRGVQHPFSFWDEARRAAQWGAERVAPAA